VGQALAEETLGFGSSRSKSASAPPRKQQAAGPLPRRPGFCLQGGLPKKGTPLYLLEFPVLGTILPKKRQVKVFLVEFWLGFG
jgi:hypothetical protein